MIILKNEEGVAREKKMAATLGYRITFKGREELTVIQEGDSPM